MPRPRSELISLSDTPYYHCVSRCVRRAYLCGQDIHSGQSYEHRRQWVESRLLFLAGIFSVHLCAYAVMSNHSHVVLKVDTTAAQAWSPREVLQRWHRLFRGTLLTRKFCDPTQKHAMSAAEHDTVLKTAEVYRARLYDISWFMRSLNEYIARQANKEDNCTGRFWEGRFKSQAIMDEASLAACMVYVDLNPVRACSATTPEESDYTSIKKRIRCALYGRQPARLYPFIGDPKTSKQDGLPFHLDDYLQLLDMTGRVKSPEKHGVIRHNIIPFLQRTGLDTVCWKKLTDSIETRFSTAISLSLIHRRLGHNAQLSSA